MIQTLTTNSYLYKVNRHRQQFLTQIEKRRAVMLCAGITASVTISTLIWILYGK